MDRKIILNTPVNRETLRSLRAGDSVLINGVIYTARDAAHKRLIELISRNETMPFDIKDQIIYYAGPCPAKPGQVIGSIGPTTSGRMDAYTPQLIRMGLAGMIGKGLRSNEVIKAMVEFGAVYFGAVGGAGALLSKCITGQEVIAFPDLGTEAVRKLTVRDFPVTVVIDAEGNNLYEMGRKKYTVGAY